MLMMRLQRVGRKNDPSYRIVVTDRRTSPKSNKHVALLGSYSPKANRFSMNADAAKEWIAKGVQLSDTVHNLLATHKIIDAKKINALPRKSPIVDEAKIKAEADAKAKAEADAKAAEEARVAAEELPSSEEVVAEEAPAETAPEVATEAGPAEEVVA